MNIKPAIPHVRHIIAIVFMTLPVVAHSQEAKWLTDYPKALEEAKTQNKPILLNFTGSDWCGWCMKMKKDSLNTPMFKRYAKKNLVLLEVDFPKGKRQSEDLKEQNQKLKQKYGQTSYPTFVLIDNEEKELGRQKGSVDGGPSAFIKLLNTFYTPTEDTTDVKSSDSDSDFDSYFKKAKPSPTP